jgi:hypothetical protein
VGRRTREPSWWRARNSIAVDVARVHRLDGPRPLLRAGEAQAEPTERPAALSRAAATRRRQRRPRKTPALRRASLSSSRPRCPRGLRRQAEQLHVQGLERSAVGSGSPSPSSGSTTSAHAESHRRASQTLTPRVPAIAVAASAGLATGLTEPPSAHPSPRRALDHPDVGQEVPDAPARSPTASGGRDGAGAGARPRACRSRRRGGPAPRPAPTPPATPGWPRPAGRGSPRAARGA